MLLLFFVYFTLLLFVQLLNKHTAAENTADDDKKCGEKPTATLTWTVISFGRNVVPRSTTRCNRRWPFSSRNSGTPSFSLDGVSAPPAAGLLDGDRECVDPQCECEGLWIAYNMSQLVSRDCSLDLYCLAEMAEFQKKLIFGVYYKQNSKLERPRSCVSFRGDGL